MFDYKGKKFDKKEINFTDAELDGIQKVTIEMSLQMAGEYDKFTSFSTPDVMRMLEEEYDFNVDNFVQYTTIFNNVESRRHGVWVMTGRNKNFQLAEVTVELVEKKEEEKEPGISKSIQKRHHIQKKNREKKENK